MLKNFEKFAKSSWGLEVLNNGGIIFRSKKSGVGGLLDFIKVRGCRVSANLVIFDKIVGRGAALLAAYIGAREVYGVVGSKLAADTLRKCGTKFYFQETIRCILNKDKTDICPIEKLSFGKSPEELYHCLRGMYDGNSRYRIPYCRGVDSSGHIS